jgi:hypothetical protein
MIIPIRLAEKNADRFLLIWLLSLVPFHSAIAILRPKTIIRWHRPELGHIRPALLENAFSILPPCSPIATRQQMT